jgi:hypothetical protein
MSLRTLVPRSIAVAWAATIAVAFVVSLLFSVVAEFRSNAPVQWQDMAMAPIFALMAAAVSAYVSLAIALVFGIPIFYVLRRLGLTSVRAYLFAGALLSMLSLVLLYTAYQFKIFLYGQPSLVRIAVSIALVAGPVATLTMRRFDRSGEAHSTGSKRA